jgi:hypothetical protein
MDNIDWTDPECQVTEHFKVKDLIMLHNWNRLANDSDGFDDDMKAKAVVLAQKAEEVRAVLGCSMNSHCGLRTVAYNEEQNIKPAVDVHSFMCAMDFDSNSTMSIEDVKAKLLPHLAELGIRMEFGTTTWVHFDLRAPGPSGRYFHV